ncbi:MAG: valine--tRNA ligase [Patescibacteria group bacterium]
MDKQYQHQKTEDRIYQLWLDSGQFAPGKKLKSGAKSFTVIMPPPNANDSLHVGHALGITIQDVLTRYHRMLGDDTLYLPSTDHAGIETQYVYEKNLAKTGKSRFDFDRQTLYRMIWDYVQNNSQVAMAQTKRLGASTDWSRFKFTLDEDIQDFVLTTFEKLYKDGLIYRDYRLVNYSPAAGTSYSNLEVVYVNRTSPLYYVRYPLLPLGDAKTKDDKKIDTSSKYVVVATTRPEPIFVDTHLAVNPKDKKNRHLIGQQVLNPLTDQPMTIIGDDFVDPKFGTGVVKLTPAHDHDDYRVAKKHNLPIIAGIDTRGKITENGGKYAGLSVKKARLAVVEDLQAKGLIEKINEHYQNRVATCYKTGQPIEPLPLPQFFIKVKDPKHNLVKKALASLNSKETKIHGAGREKILRHWLKNLEDWNISRQIVWGIKMPIWYQVDGFEDQINLSFIDQKKQQKFGLLQDLLKKTSLKTISKGLQQISAGPDVPFIISRNQPTTTKHKYLPETDTFDTWFSSSQWPVATLATNQTTDLKRFYPTQVMDTSYDILPFWVMRMMLMCTYLAGKSPFKDVYLHGLVRDAKGIKMSKSKGNVVNPLQIVDQYGADALRMAIVIRSTAGQDKSFGEADYKAGRNLANKLWNAARYVLSQDADSFKDNKSDPKFTLKLKKVVNQIIEQLDQLKIGQAADTLYNHFWHWYCDQVIESAKQNQVTLPQLQAGLATFVKLFHPFMPFITEQIWQELFKKKLVTDSLLMTSPWPKNSL